MDIGAKGQKTCYTQSVQNKVLYVLWAASRFLLSSQEAVALAGDDLAAIGQQPSCCVTASTAVS